MKLLFTICARAGSKGVKNKNIRGFLGYPLVYYTLAAYVLFLEKYATLYDEINLCVNTDSSELIEQIRNTDIMFTHIIRKESLAGDRVSKPAVIKDTIVEMEINNKKKYDIVVDLDLTSPLRTADDIYGTINKLAENEFMDVAFSMTDARRLPFFNMVALQEDDSYSTVIKSGYVSRQEAPACFDMNASIYAYRRNFILSKDTNSVFDGKAIGYRMLDTGVLDIDSEEDLELLEVIADYFFRKHESYMEVIRLVLEFNENRIDSIKK